MQSQSNQVEPPQAKTNPACISLSKFSSHHLLKRKARVENAKEGGKGDPVQVSQQSDVWLPSRNKTPVRKPYVDNPPQAVEEEGLEVDNVDKISLECQHLAPEQSVF